MFSFILEHPAKRQATSFLSLHNSSSLIESFAGQASVSDAFGGSSGAPQCEWQSGGDEPHYSSSSLSGRLGHRRRRRRQRRDELAKVQVRLMWPATSERVSSHPANFASLSGQDKFKSSDDELARVDENIELILSLCTFILRHFVESSCQCCCANATATSLLHRIHSSSLFFSLFVHLFVCLF